MSKSRFWEQILQFIEEGRAIPIIGQDVLSIRVGHRDVLLHHYLAEKLAEDLGVSAEDLPAGGELNAVACRFMSGPERGDLGDVYPALKKIMPRKDEIALPASLLKLAQIRPLKLFVTTTFDPLLQWALDEVRFGGQPRTDVLSYSPETVTDLPCESGALDRPLVYHLMGRLSVVPDYAVTEEDTLEFVHALQTPSKRPERLFDELRRQELIVIGNHFPDWLTRFFVRTTACERLSVSSGKNFVASDAVRGNEGLMRFLAHFSARTKVYEDGGPVEFVDELSKRWQERHPEDEAPGTAARATSAESEMEPGAVFLSYASEDVDTVRLIRDALESAGIDVWFDKAALQAGDDFGLEISGNIDYCSVFMPIISRHTVGEERRYFRIEWKHAEQVAEMVPPSVRFIVPVAIDDISVQEKTIPQAWRDIHWERAPEGHCRPEFLSLMKQLFRKYHETHRSIP